jgi:hypothetical protein
MLWVVVDLSICRRNVETSILNWGDGGYTKEGKLNSTPVWYSTVLYCTVLYSKVSTESG